MKFFQNLYLRYNAVLDSYAAAEYMRRHYLD